MLDGGAGNDTLDGGQGGGQLNGTGAGGDRIDVSGAVIPWMKAGDPLLSGVVRLVQSGTSTLVQLDSDGNGGSDFLDPLLTLQNAAASSLTIDNFLYTPAAGASALAPVQLVGVMDDAALIA